VGQSQGEGHQPPRRSRRHLCIASASVCNQATKALSALFAWAIKEEIVAVNPCKGIEHHPLTSRERILSDSELPLFWSAFDDAGLVHGAALRCLLLLGQRPGETSHMRKEHVVDGWWTMPGEPVPALGWPGTKNAMTHRIWLPAPVRDIIADLDDGDATTGFVFAGERGGPVTNLDGIMRTICAKLGVERAVPHDLRRTHGSTVTKLGLGRDIMNRIQNHREGGIASVYDRYSYADEIKRAMELVAARIFALATGQALVDNNIVSIRA
jgi:integrase